MTPGARFGHLDGLRGLAAYLVVVHHAFFVLLPPAFDPATMLRIAMTPVGPLINGQAFVYVFFVLSGFALTLLLERPRPYAVYAARRLVRLWPPVLGAVLVSVLLSYGLGGTGQTEGYAAFLPTLAWNHPDTITIAEVIRHVALTGNAGDTELNPVLWSLVFEVRLSLLMPVIVWAVARHGGRAVAVAVVAGIAAELALHGRFGFDQRLMLGEGLFRVEDPVGSLLATIVVVPAFTIGAWMARHRDRIAAAAPSGRTVGAAVVLVAAGVSAPSITASILASALLLALVHAVPRLRNLLTTPPALWSGAISYSLYLVHLPVQLATINLLGGWLPRVVVMIAGIGFATAVATAFHRVVEAPSAAWSRRIGRA